MKNFEPPVCDVIGVSILEGHFIVPCEKRSSRNRRGLNSVASIRVYDGQRSFDLLMLMVIEEIGTVGDLVSNRKSQSLFVPDEWKRCIWKIRWSDHRTTIWKGHLQWPLTLSVSSEGNLILITEDHLRIYDTHAILISSVPLSSSSVTKYPEYLALSPVGYYSVSHGLNFSRAVLVDRSSDRDYGNIFPLEMMWKSQLAIPSRKPTDNETGEEIVPPTMQRLPFIIPEFLTEIDEETFKSTVTASVFLSIPTLTPIDSDNYPSAGDDDPEPWWTHDQPYSGFENRMAFLYDCPSWLPCKTNNWPEFRRYIGRISEMTFCYEDASGHLIISATSVGLRSASAVFIVRLL